MKHIFANWKMYLNLKDSCDLAKKIADESDNFDFDKINLTLFPTYLSFSSVENIFKNKNINTGVQNVSWTPQGAYTGSTSAFLSKEAGANYSIVGHSERRYIFGEKNDDVRKKIEACLDADIVPVLCIGETAEDKEADKREYRLKKQLMKALSDLDFNNKQVIIAYEPVWAISHDGKSEHCPPVYAEEAMNWIKTEIKQYTDQEIPVLYGGSVKADNVVSYASLDSCDGVLVGSASTKYEEFISLIKEVQNI
jgi:triosephosphate isomerase (TIM)